MKKYFNFSLLFTLLICPLISCGDIDYENIYDFKMNYQDGQVVFTCENAEGFKVYSCNYGEKTFYYNCKVDGTTYKCDDIYKTHYFVPIKNNRELTNFQSREFNYHQGVFNSSKVKVFSPKDSQSVIQKHINETYDALQKSEFSDDRESMLFLPGSYGNVTLNVGYYTSVNGLGEFPSDVSIKKLEVGNHPNTGNALINFWRSVENIKVNSSLMWAVSQATSLRRMYFEGDLLLSDSEPGKENYSSGGFISDSVINKTINSGSQQQWLIRNSIFGKWNHSNMNMVFIGTNGTLPQGDWYSNKTTFVEKAPIVQEKPYIMFDSEKGYGIKIVDRLTDHSSITWRTNDIKTSKFISLNEFYIANPEADDDISLNSALEEGKNILFTPGIYNLNKPLLINNEDTILYGLGLATLNITDNNSDGLMLIKNEKGVKVCGLLFQAGKSSEYLLKVGEEKNNNDNKDNPICLSDCFFRLGGNTLEKTSVDTCVILNTNDVLGDNFWVWRADHGVKDAFNESKGVGWFKNHGKNGIIVNGDDFLIYGLMVEHFNEYQTIWNGESGRMFFYQSETPYDALSQEDWINANFEGDYALGYASYKVNDDVKNHEAIGLGIYFINSIKNVEKFVHHAIETPDAEGVKFSGISARYFGGAGRILNLINNVKGVEDDYKNLTLHNYSNEIYD